MPRALATAQMPGCATAMEAAQSTDERSVEVEAVVGDRRCISESTATSMRLDGAAPHANEPDLANVHFGK